MLQRCAVGGESRQAPADKLFDPLHVGSHWSQYNDTRVGLDEFEVPLPTEGDILGFTNRWTHLR